MRTIAPSDAAVAARSFSRRWRALFARAVGDAESYTPSEDDALHRSGAIKSCHRAAELLAHTATQLPGTVTSHVSAGAHGVLELVDVAANRLASVIESVPADDWKGEPIELLTRAIDEAASLLREAERAIDEALASQ
jgi:hypothetical protein